MPRSHLAQPLTFATCTGGETRADLILEGSGGLDKALGSGAMADLRIDPNSLWFKGTAVITLLGAAIWGTAFYYSVKTDLAAFQVALKVINDTVERKLDSLERAVEATNNKSDKDNLSMRTYVNEGVQSIKMELKDIVIGFLNRRAAETWIEQDRIIRKNFVELLRARNKDLNVPDFPAPDLPK